MRRWTPLFLTVLVLVACRAPEPPAKTPDADPQASGQARSPEETPEFADDFESGDTASWDDKVEEEEEEEEKEHVEGPREDTP